MTLRIVALSLFIACFVGATVVPMTLLRLNPLIAIGLGSTLGIVNVLLTYLLWRVQGDYLRSLGFRW